MKEKIEDIALTDPEDFDRVVFLKHKNEDGTFGDVFAFFPFVDWDMEGNKTAYEKIGQHGACAVDYAKECAPAAPDEYRELQEEMEGPMMSYNLMVMDAAEWIKEG